MPIVFSDLVPASRLQLPLLPAGCVIKMARILHSFPCSLPVPPDLTPEERLELDNIRRRKQELLVEIQRLRDELSEAMNEVEGLEANEGR